MFMLLAVDPVEGPDQLQVIWTHDGDERPADETIRALTYPARRFQLDRGGGLCILALPESD